jgi:hypothetical protein
MSNRQGTPRWRCEVTHHHADTKIPKIDTLFNIILYIRRIFPVGN